MIECNEVPDELMRELTFSDADDTTIIEKEVPNAEPSSEMEDDYEYWERRAVEAMEFEDWCKEHPSEFGKDWFINEDCTAISRKDTYKTP